MPEGRGIRGVTDEMSEDYIVNYVDETFGGFGESLNIVKEMLTQTPQEFNGAIWQAMTSISNAIMPIAYSILSICIILEFIDKITRVDMNLDIETIFKIVIKLLIAKMVMVNCFNFLNIIFSITSSVVTAVGGATGTTLTLDTAEQVKDIIQSGDYGMLDRIGIYIQLLPMGLIFSGIKIITSIIVYGRFIQLYVLTALAPLPIAAVGYEKTRNISMRFFQEYIAICLQGVVIMITVNVYIAMVGSAAIAGGGLGDVLWETVKIALIVIVSIIGSNTLARKIVGV